MKACRICGVEKPADLFKKNHKGTFALICKACDAVRNRERYRERYRPFTPWRMAVADEPTKAAMRREQKRRYQDPEWWAKMTARRPVYRAIRNSVIVRPMQCEQCQAAGKTQAHHEDYSKPLEVKWLCSACHGMKHRKYA